MMFKNSGNSDVTNLNAPRYMIWNMQIQMYIPKGPCTHIVYTLALKYSMGTWVRPEEVALRS